MVGFWLKIQMEMVYSNDLIFSSLPFLHIFVQILTTVMHQSAEAQPGPISFIYLFSLYFKLTKYMRILAQLKNY